MAVKHITRGEGWYKVWLLNVNGSPITRYGKCKAEDDQISAAQATLWRSTRRQEKFATFGGFYVEFHGKHKPSGHTLREPIDYWYLDHCLRPVRNEDWEEIWDRRRAN